MLRVALELLDEVLIQRPARDAIGAHLCKAVVLEIDVNVVDRRVKILIAGAQAGCAHHQAAHVRRAAQARHHVVVRAMASHPDGVFTKLARGRNPKAHGNKGVNQLSPL